MSNSLLRYLCVRVPTAQRIQGKRPPKNACQGEYSQFGNYTKTPGIWFAQVVNSLILKLKDIAMFAAKIPKTFLGLNKSATSVLCM